MLGPILKTNARITRTLDAYQREGEVIKPVELIEIRHGERLTLLARRIFNLLLENAFGPDMAEVGRRFSIPLSALRGNHANNEHAREAILQLMDVVLIAIGNRGAGNEIFLHLISGGEIIPGDVSRPTIFEYGFDPRLLLILQDSKSFAILETRVLAGFKTKYGMSLYELVSSRYRQQHVFSEEFEVADLRGLLGVEPDKLRLYGDFRRFALDPAVSEVNRLAPFSCSVEIGKRSGRRIDTLCLRWWVKTIEERKQQWQDEFGSPLDLELME